MVFGEIKCNIVQRHVVPGPRAVSVSILGWNTELIHDDFMAEFGWLVDISITCADHCHQSMSNVNGYSVYR